jgi:hypothetical protein
MNADGTVEEGRGEQVGITRTPLNLEGPVICRRELTRGSASGPGLYKSFCSHLSNDLGSLGIPAQSTIILPT